MLARGLTLHHSCSRRERAWARSTPTAQAPCTARRGRATCRRCRLCRVCLRVHRPARTMMPICVRLWWAIGGGGVCAAQLRRDVGKYANPQVLLEWKAEANARDRRQVSPLHEACKNGHLECVHLLLRHKADPNSKKMNSSVTNGGFTPLHFAASRGTSSEQRHQQMQPQIHRLPACMRRSRCQPGTHHMQTKCAATHLSDTQCRL